LRIVALSQGHNHKFSSLHQWRWTRRLHHPRWSDEASHRRHAAAFVELSEIPSGQINNYK
jgi:hypothetical protein